MGRQLIVDTINRKNTRATAFWVGHPTDDAKEIYFDKLGIVSSKEETDQELVNREAATTLANKSGKADVDFSKKVQSDMIWLSPELNPSCWKSPDGKPMWDVLEGKKRKSLTQPGVFAETTDVADVEKFDWPNPDNMDFAPAINDVKYALQNDLAIFGGMWSSFFHVVSDFFGMENYFIKMYTNPDVVQAVTERVVDFYLKANDRCLQVMGEDLDAAFFGNDLGSQRGLLISNEMLEKFVFPYYKKIIDGIKKHNLKVALHSCGAVSSAIPKFIELGVDILHPLQARAAGMDADSIKQYKNDIIFMGGIDTQELLPFGKPNEIEHEVNRVRDALGNGFIISPSHEALLSNVSIENVMAMSRAAKGE